MTRSAFKPQEDGETIEHDGSGVKDTGVFKNIVPSTEKDDDSLNSESREHTVMRSPSMEKSKAEYDKGSEIMCNDDQNKNDEIEAIEKDRREEEEEEEEDDDDDEDDDEEDDEEEEEVLEGVEDEDEDEEEEPPLLKYSRISELPKNFFTRDSISACQFHDKVFAFATHSGFVHFTEPDFTAIRTFKCHRASITSIFTDGEYFATSSIDGSVVVGSVRTNTDMLACDFKRPVHAVVLDEKYKTSKTFVSGGMAGEIILSQRNWLGNRVDIILDKNDGPVVGIYTLDDVLFWMNDNGITFYSISSKTRLLQVPFPKEEQGTRPDLYWPSVHFPETDTILIAWANHIWTFKISLTKSSSHGNPLGSILSSAASSLRAAPDRKVELEHYLYVDNPLSGVVTFRNDQLLCLEVPKSKVPGKKSDSPLLKLLDMLTGEEIHSDEVILKSYQNLNANDYHLGKHIGKGTSEYYMISAKDAVSAHELSLKERFDWYLTMGNCYEAWKIGLFAVSCRERLDAGESYIKKLIAKENWDEAASAITEVFSGTDIEGEDEDFRNYVIFKWGKYISVLESSRKMDIIAPLIPKKPALDPRIYDEVLKYYLGSGQISQFSNYIHNWPNELFTSSLFQNMLEEMIEKDDKNSVEYRTDLIYLLLNENQELKAIPHLIKMKDSRAFDIIQEKKVLPMYSNQLLDVVLVPYNDKVENLQKLSLEEATRIFAQSMELLVQGSHMINVKTIIAKLSSRKEIRVLLFLFFQLASKKEPLMITPFENDMVELYYEFDHPHLLEFLKSKNDYDVERAIDLCSKDENCFNELIYLWGKVGETRKALSLIIDKKDDPELAIQFVKNSRDPDLWEYLVTYSLTKPRFIKELLDPRASIGNAYTEVVKRVPENMEIEGLKALLESATKENLLSLNVNMGIFKIIDEETKEFANEFLQWREMGRSFEL